MTNPSILVTNIMPGGKREVAIPLSGNRVKVVIRCKRCGEQFTLRGRKERGRIDTGFKMCICNNTDDFEMEEDE